MGIDANAVFSSDETLAARTPNKLAAGLKGSQILRIAGHVRQLQGEGRTVANFTIGDFHPSQFTVPSVLKEEIATALQSNQTFYPPAVGIPELRRAVRSFYSSRLGLDYPEGTVQVGAGARPPIFAAFQTIVEAGDKVVYPIPTWNLGYYVYLSRAEAVAVQTKAENSFMPTAADLAPHLAGARMLVLNSPLNPAGTVITKAQLTEICDLVLAENASRRASGERPLIVLYDQVYWQLTFGDHEHITPVHCNPEMANYTVLIDAISKCWAGTGLRVGWAVAPPWVRDRMKPLVGHMGAWAGRSEQLATSVLLEAPERVDPWMSDFKSDIRSRLVRLHEGLQSLKAEGLPVDSLDPQGAIYLSAYFGLHGKSVPGGTLESDEDVRSYILEQAGVAVVPFTAFGYPQGTGWVRFSVGSVSEDDIDLAITNLRKLLR